MTAARPFDLERNKHTSRRWHESWGTDAIEAAYAECLAPEFTAQFFGQGVVDRDSYIRQDRNFAKAFSDTSIKVEDIVAEGDTVMVRMTWRGTHSGEMLGIPATGKRFEVSGFALDRFRDGRVVEHIPLFDQPSLLRQLDGDRTRWPES
jgi:steroid delta-isomerase-like uncharacterized protein